MANKFDFTLGADPEFVCVDGRTLVESGAYTNNYDQFGCDGNGIIFEARPEPATNPLEVVSNIHDIFARKVHADKQFAKFHWKAGSFYADMSLGGHIHFGIPNKKIDTRTCAQILDNYLAVLTALIEHKNQALRRRQGNYGHPTDTRVQDWGFEYRTCASWLTSPYVAAAVLCLAKTVMYELANNPRFEPRLVVRNDDIMNMDTETLLSYFPDLWKDITSMELYQQYKPYIDLIYFLIKKKLTWFPSTSLKEAWGLVDLTIAKEDKLKMDVIWERFNQEVRQHGAAFATPVERPHIYR